MMYRRAKQIWTRVRARSSYAARPLITMEDFQVEIARLGLSGKEFSPEDYAAALALYCDIEIVVRVLADSSYPEFARALARSGRVAMISYDATRRTAVILVPGSLPPMARALAAYHELAHVAAGDLCEESPRRLAKEPPLENEVLREREADARACYALLAGSLGPVNPYAERMYDAL